MNPAASSNQVSRDAAWCTTGASDGELPMPLRDWPRRREEGRCLFRQDISFQGNSTTAQRDPHPAESCSRSALQLPASRQQRHPSHRSTQRVDAGSCQNFLSPTVRCDWTTRAGLSVPLLCPLLPLPTLRGIPTRPPIDAGSSFEPGFRNEPDFTGFPPLSQKPVRWPFLRSCRRRQKYDEAEEAHPGSSHQPRPPG